MAVSEYYDHGTYPSQGAVGSSSAARAEFKAIEDGISAKLPDLAGNGGKITAVNAGATAMEAITTTGTGSGVRATSPTLVTPVLGVATLTSANKVTITAPATAATLALAEGSTLATSGAFSQTLTATAATNVTLPTTGTLATLAGAETLTNKTLTSPAITAPTGITATNISNTPAGGVTETTVQGAINGLETRKAKSGANSDITSLAALSVGGLPNGTVTAPDLDGAQTGSAPIYAARAWVNFNGDGTVAIRASGNVSSISDAGVGDYQINFITAMPDVNYAVIGTAMRASANIISLCILGDASYATYQLTTSCRVNTRENSNTPIDALAACVSIFR